MIFLILKYFFPSEITLLCQVLKMLALKYFYVLVTINKDEQEFIYSRKQK